MMNLYGLDWIYHICREFYLKTYPYGWLQPKIQSKECYRMNTHDDMVDHIERHQNKHKTKLLSRRQTLNSDASIEKSILFYA